MTTPDTTSREQPAPWHGGAKLGLGSLLIGVIGLAITFIGFRTDPGHAFHSYLTAYAFTMSLALGGLAFVMISYTAHATWPVAVRRLAEAASSALPLLIVLFVPILFGLKQLYPWTHPDSFDETVRRVLTHRQAVMNPGFFALRAFGYLVLWTAFAWLLRRYSVQMDGARDAERIKARARALSYAGLPLCCLTAGFAGFDWFMSVDPMFSSSMFGVVWVAMCLFGGTAITIWLASVARARPDFTLAGPSHNHALGRLLFAFLIFLGYVSYFQYMLCWIGNLPYEAAWFLARYQGLYRWESLFLFFGHFALPFLVLLSFSWKHRSGVLAPVSAWCLFSQFVHAHWLITPAAAEPGFAWFDLSALVGVAGVSVSFCVWLQRGKALAPIGDPLYAASLRYVSH